jgi:hypothetical protein
MTGWKEITTAICFNVNHREKFRKKDRVYDGIIAAILRTVDMYLKIKPKRLT